MVTDPNNYKKFDKEGAERYANTAEKVFAPLYPILARQLIERFNITSGVCIDIGSGTAALAIELARISNLTVYALDHADEIQNIAERKVIEAGMKKRVKITRADVLEMPFADNFADLIVSRGTVFFWKQLHMAFSEIYRVLKPGGNACIGSGSGSKKLKEEIIRKMLERNPDFERNGKKRFNPEVEKRIKDAVEKSIIPEYKAVKDDTGFWIVFTKS
jgi:ubiquinone/menaquinone biosynthesis C-methylase UbiE